MEQLRGQIVALYLFDVAESIDLQVAAGAISSSVRANTAEAGDPRLCEIPGRAAAVRRRSREHSHDRRLSRGLQGVRLRHYLAAHDARVRRHMAAACGRVRSA